MHQLLRTAAISSICFFSIPSGAHAQAPLIGGLGGPAGFGTGVMARTDDGASAAIPVTSALPDGLFFAGTTWTDIYVNNNGNVSFGGPIFGVVPFALPRTSRPMIAPYYADVDTRPTLPSGRNLVYWSVELGRVVVTYYDVGYYASHVDRLNSFQLILTPATSAGASAGDFDVELRYNRCEWTTGDATGGSGGLGGVPAQAGFDAGDGMTAYTLPGSMTAAALAFCTTSNVGIAGVWRFRIRRGFVAVECGNGILEAGEECDDGNDAPLDGCSATCETEAVLGTACALGSECLSGFCADGVCCDGACGGQCEACDLPSSPGECAAVTGAPRNGRPACGGTSPCDGTCDGSSRGGCAFPDATVACEDGAFCTVGDACDGTGGCAPGGARACSDGDPCTTDSCDAATDSCAHAYTGGCAIDGTCLAPGAIDPSSPCRACQPLFSRTEYTLREVGARCEDGLFCTSDDACGPTGECIPGPARDCDDGLACTIDACDEEADACASLPDPSCVDAGGDAGMHDGGVEADAGGPLDGGGGHELDAAPADGGSGGPEAPGAGCACRIDRGGPATPAALAWCALGLVLFARRRRRR